MHGKQLFLRTTLSVRISQNISEYMFAFSLRSRTILIINESCALFGICFVIVLLLDFMRWFFIFLHFMSAILTQHLLSWEGGVSNFVNLCNKILPVLFSLDYRVERRLEFRASYRVRCLLLQNKIVEATLSSIAASKFNQIREICEKGESKVLFPWKQNSSMS